MNDSGVPKSEGSTIWTMLYWVKQIYYFVQICIKISAIDTEISKMYKFKSKQNKSKLYIERKHEYIFGSSSSSLFIILILTLSIVLKLQKMWCKVNDSWLYQRYLNVFPLDLLN